MNEKLTLIQGEEIEETQSQATKEPTPEERKKKREQDRKKHNEAVAREYHLKPSNKKGKKR